MDGWTLLHYACDSNNDTYKIPLLLSQGANVNAQSKHGNTPLHLICRGHGNAYVKHARILFRHGARLDIVNKHGQTPYQMSIDWNNKGLQRYLDSLIRFTALYTLFGVDIARDLFVNS